MAYRADIEIAVRGAQELKRLSDQISATSKLVDGLNNYLQNIGTGGVVRNINNLKQAVSDAAASFNKVALGTEEATLAAQNYITATKNLNSGLQERLTLLNQITEAERKQRLAAAGIQETTQYKGVIGPGAASPVALASQLRGRTEQILKLEKISVDAANTAFDLAVQHENTLKNIKLKAEDFVFNEKLEKLEALAAAELKLIKQVDAAAVADFDKRLTARQERKTARKKQSAAGSKMFENLMLGAGFPLLFGGGAGEVAGGLLGSFVGTGFGGQILGSAIGRIFQDLSQAAIDLAKTLESPVSSFEQIKEKSLLSSRAQERYVETLIKNGQIAEANAVIYEDFNNRFGGTTLNTLRINSDKLTRSISELGVRLQLVVSGPLNDFTERLNNVLAGVNLEEQAQKIEGQLQGPQKQQFERERAIITGLQFKGIFGGITQEEAVKRMTELLEKYEKFVPKKNVPLSVDDLKLQLEAVRSLRDVYAENFRLQLEKGLAIKVLNGQILQDYIRANEIQNDYLTTNEKLAVVIKNVKDIEAAGGVAKGIVSAKEMGELKNEITALQNKKLDLQIQANKDSLARFEKEIKAAGDRATRALDLQAGAVRGGETLAQSEFTLQKSLNDLYSQRLDMEVELLNKNLEQTTSLAQQEAILARLEEIAGIRYEIAIANAKIERASAYAQIKANLQLLAIETRKQEVALKVAEAAMFEAKAKGLLNSDYVNAVNAQADALRLSQQNYDYAVRNAVTQERIADAMYDQKIEAAGFARNLELAGLASRRNSLFAGDGGNYNLGNGPSGLGQPYIMGRTYSPVTIKAMATGGFVGGPTMALIGEGGEGEYVVPESKASAFAMNYMLGARGTGAINGSASSPSITIQTGPVMQQNGQNYVTIQDMEASLQAVADTILNNSRSYSTRRYTGVA